MHWKKLTKISHEASLLFLAYLKFGNMKGGDPDSMDVSGL
jgi:hypothetical protein